MNSSPQDSPSAKAPGAAIKLKVIGIGNVPSFKNRKRAILDSRTGKLRTLTDPRAKKWMARCIDQFEFQLITIFRMRDGETVGEWQKRLRIALSPLLDDSWRDMLPGPQNVHRVEAGQEGAEITIEYD